MYLDFVNKEALGLCQILTQSHSYTYYNSCNTLVGKQKLDLIGQKLFPSSGIKSGTQEHRIHTRVLKHSCLYRQVSARF